MQQYTTALQDGPSDDSAPVAIIKPPMPASLSFSPKAALPENGSTTRLHAGSDADATASPVSIQTASDHSKYQLTSQVANSATNRANRSSTVGSTLSAAYSIPDQEVDDEPGWEEGLVDDVDWNALSPQKPTRETVAEPHSEIQQNEKPEEDDFEAVADPWDEFNDTPLDDDPLKDTTQAPESANVESTDAPDNHAHEEHPSVGAHTFDDQESLPQLQFDQVAEDHDYHHEHDFPANAEYQPQDDVYAEDHVHFSQTSPQAEQGDFNDQDFQEQDFQEQDFQGQDFQAQDLQGQDFQDHGFHEQGDFHGQDFNEQDFTQQKSTGSEAGHNYHHENEHFEESDHAQHNDSAGEYAPHTEELTEDTYVAQYNGEDNFEDQNGHHVEAHDDYSAYGHESLERPHYDNYQQNFESEEAPTHVDDTSDFGHTRNAESMEEREFWNGSAIHQEQEQEQDYAANLPLQHDVQGDQWHEEVYEESQGAESTNKQPESEAQDHWDDEYATHEDYPNHSVAASEEVHHAPYHEEQINQDAGDRAEYGHEPHVEEVEEPDTWNYDNDVNDYDTRNDLDFWDQQAQHAEALQSDEKQGRPDLQFHEEIANPSQHPAHAHNNVQNVVHEQFYGEEQHPLNEHSDIQNGEGAPQSERVSEGTEFASLLAPLVEQTADEVHYEQSHGAEDTPNDFLDQFAGSDEVMPWENSDTADTVIRPVERSIDAILDDGEDDFLSDAVHPDGHNDTDGAADFDISELNDEDAALIDLNLDDDMLLDDDFLEEEDILPEPTTDQGFAETTANESVSEIQSLITAPSSIPQQPSEKKKANQASKYAPVKPLTPVAPVKNVAAANFGAHQSQNAHLQPSIAGPVQPQQQFVSKLTAQASISIVKPAVTPRRDPIKEQLEQNKKKNDAYDFPVDLVKKPKPAPRGAHSAAPLPHHNNEVPTHDAPTVLKDASRSTLSKSFFEELPIANIAPQKRPSRAEASKYASSQSSVEQISHPANQSLAAAPIKVPKNPYATVDIPKQTVSPATLLAQPGNGLPHGRVPPPANQVPAPQTHGIQAPNYLAPVAETVHPVPAVSKSKYEPSHAPIGPTPSVQTGPAIHPVGLVKPPQAGFQNNPNIPLSPRLQQQPRLQQPLAPFAGPPVSVGKKGPASPRINSHSARAVEKSSSLSPYVPDSGPYAPTGAARGHSRTGSIIGGKSKEGNPYAPLGAEKSTMGPALNGPTGFAKPASVRSRAKSIGRLNGQARAHVAAPVTDPAALLRRQFPLFSWGASESVAVLIPQLSNGFEPSRNTIRIEKSTTLLPELEAYSDFPGPLSKGKSKKKDIETWLSKQFGHLHQDPLRQNELLLCQVLSVLVESDGAFLSADVQKKIGQILTPNVDFSFDHKAAPTFLGQGGPGIAPNAYKLDNSGVSMIWSLLQSGNQESALEYAISKQDWAFAFIIALSLGPERFNSVTSDYARISYPFQTNQKTKIQHLMPILMKVLVGNAKGAVDDFIKVPSEGEFMIAHYREILSAVVVNGCNGEFLVDFGKFLADAGMITASELCFVIAGIVMSHLPMQNGGVFGVVGKETQTTIYTEIYEHILQASTNTGNMVPQFGFPHLFPLKIRRAQVLADLGHFGASRKYCDLINQTLKSLGKTPHVPEHVLLEFKRLLFRLSNSSASDGGWLGLKLSRVNLDKVWGQLDKFIAGDDTSAQANEKGVFSKFSPSVSRNSSVIDVTNIPGALPQRTEHVHGMLGNAAVPQMINRNQPLRYAPGGSVPQASPFGSATRAVPQGTAPQRPSENEPRRPQAALYSNNNEGSTLSLASQGSTAMPSKYAPPSATSGRVEFAPKASPQSHRRVPSDQKLVHETSGSSAGGSKPARRDSNGMEFLKPARVGGAPETSTGSSHNADSIPSEAAAPPTNNAVVPGRPEVPEVVVADSAHFTEPDAEPPITLPTHQVVSKRQTLEESTTIDLEVKLKVKIERTSVSSEKGEAVDDSLVPTSEIENPRKESDFEKPQEGPKEAEAELQKREPAIAPPRSVAKPISNSPRKVNPYAPGASRAQPTGSNKYGPGSGMRNQWYAAGRTEAKRSYAPTGNPEVTRKVEKQSIETVQHYAIQERLKDVTITDTGLPPANQATIGVPEVSDDLQGVPSRYEVSSPSEERPLAAIKPGTNVDESFDVYAGDEATEEAIGSPKARPEPLILNTMLSPTIPSGSSFANPYQGDQKPYQPEHRQNALLDRFSIPGTPDYTTRANSMVGRMNLYSSRLSQSQQSELYHQYEVKDDTVLDYVPVPEEDEEDEEETKLRKLREDAKKKVEQKAAAEERAKESHSRGSEARSEHSGDSNGWLKGLFSNNKKDDKPKPIKAKLGQASTFKYDEKLKRWIDTSRPLEDQLKEAAPPPPPKSRATQPLTEERASSAPASKTEQASERPALPTGVKPRKPTVSKKESRPNLANAGLDDLLSLTGSNLGAAGRKPKRRYVNVGEKK